MISQANYFRKAYSLSYSSNQTISAGRGGFIRAVPSTGSLSLTFPDARTLSPGHRFVIWNAGGSSTLVKDASGATLGTLAANDIGRFHLVEKLSLSGTWQARVSAKL